MAGPSWTWALAHPDETRGDALQRAHASVPGTQDAVAHGPNVESGDPPGGEARAELLRVVGLVNHAAHRAIQQTWEGEQLHPTAVRVLYHVDRHPGMTLSQVARTAGLSKARTSDLLRELEERGYVCKAGDTHDRRLTRIVTSEVASGMRQRSEAVYLASIDALVSRLSDGAQRELVRALRGLDPAAADGSPAPEAVPE